MQSLAAGLSFVNSLANPIIVVALSLVLPLAVFFGQTTVGNRRLRIIEYLKTCASDIDPNSREFMIRSLEFAGARYSGSGDRSRGDRVLRCLAYLLPTALFVCLSAVGFLALLAVISMDAFEARNFVLYGLHPYDAPDFAGYQSGTALIVAAAFVGAYIWSINYLVLRVANYDLNPLSFLRVAGHLLLTIFAACVVRHVFAAMGPTVEGWTIGVLLGATFLMGFFPNMGIGLLIDRLPERLRVKRPVEQAAEIGREFPLDLIDGITPTIKFRLASFDLTDVHNLAAADPVTLYLESPFGHLEILDWIAQAQLLACVGPERFLTCRAANVRDIHGLLAAGRTDDGRKRLKTVLFDDAGATEADVRRTIDAYAATLHVQRLEHWWRAITAIMAPRRADLAEPRLAAE
jgi:hypothetical protein